MFFGRYLTLLTLLTYTRKEVSMHSSNTSIIVTPCIFDSLYRPLSGTNDGRWIFLLDGLSATSTLFIPIGAIEFYCAQVPYTMKGLGIGIFYGLENLFMLLSQALFLPFKAQSLGWVLIHQNNIHGDCDHSCSCGNEVLQDKKERRSVAK